LLRFSVQGWGKQLRKDFLRVTDKINIMNIGTESGFAGRIGYELKRAERYRYFVSLIIFNVGPILDLGGNGHLKREEKRREFIDKLTGLISNAAREVDATSDGAQTKIGLLLPETSRQGAESVARRISDSLIEFCTDYFGKPTDYLVPVEISSFPDRAGARSVASYLEEFTD